MLGSTHDWWDDKQWTNIWVTSANNTQRANTTSISRCWDHTWLRWQTMDKYTSNVGKQHTTHKHNIYIYCLGFTRHCILKTSYNIIVFPGVGIYKWLRWQIMDKYTSNVGKQHTNTTFWYYVMKENKLNQILRTDNFFQEETMNFLFGFEHGNFG